MIVLIDNYDSFTFNLVHYLGGLGADVVVHRNDKISVDDVIAAEPDAIVLSPGPCTPNEAGICLDLIEKAAADDPDPRRLPRPSGDRPGLRRRGGARAGAGARQALRDPAPGRRRLPRHQRRRSRRRATIRWWSSASTLPGRPRGHRRDRRRAGHGPRAPQPAGARRAVPSGEHRLRARPSRSCKNFLDLAAAWNAATGRRQPASSDAPVL